MCSPTEDALCWRDDDSLVLVRQGGRFLFPDRCVVRNEAATRRVRKDLKAAKSVVWTPIVFFHYLYTVPIDFALCTRHHRRRIAGWLCVALAAALVVAFFRFVESGLISLVVLPAMLVLGMVGGWLATVVRVSDCDDFHVRLKVGRRFLASISAMDD